MKYNGGNDEKIVPVNYNGKWKSFDWYWYKDSHKLEINDKKTEFAYERKRRDNVQRMIDERN